MKLIFSFLLFFTALPANSQSFGINFGAGNGRFYSIQRSDGFAYRDFSNQNTYRFSLECKDIQLDSFFIMKFLVGFEQYGGYFYARDGGHGGQTQEEGRITKNSIYLQVYPFNFKFLKHATFGLGLAANVSLPSIVEGEKRSWQLSTDSSGNNSKIESLQEIEGFVRPINLGVVSSVGYEFCIGKWILEPQYNMHLGLSNEFNQLEINTKSFRQSLSISLLKRLN